MCVFCAKVGEDGASLLGKVVQVRIVEEIRGLKKLFFLCIWWEDWGNGARLGIVF